MVDTVTESFLIVPFLIAGTDRIGLVPACSLGACPRWPTCG
jgi:hypothetical protein